MTLYVRTDYVPPSPKLTMGKLYEVYATLCEGKLGRIVADDGEHYSILLGGECAYIGKEWEQVTLEDNDEQH